jgi:hypothetical protein
MQRALMFSRAGQCGLDTAKVRLPEVQAVATMDRPANYEHTDLCDSSLYNERVYP